MRYRQRNVEASRLGYIKGIFASNLSKKLKFCVDRRERSKRRGSSKFQILEVTHSAGE